MKAAFFVLALAGAALGGLLERSATCDANNCARAVTGTRLGAASIASHTADCKSFNVVTTWVGAGVTARPTATPTYASACTKSGDYASACSCWGFPVTTASIEYDIGDDGSDGDGFWDIPPPKN